MKHNKSINFLCCGKTFHGCLNAQILLCIFLLISREIDLLFMTLHSLFHLFHGQNNGLILNLKNITPFITLNRKSQLLDFMFKAEVKTVSDNARFNSLTTLLLMSLYHRRVFLCTIAIIFKVVENCDKFYLQKEIENVLINSFA